MKTTELPAAVTANHARVHAFKVGQCSGDLFIGRVGFRSYQTLARCFRALGDAESAEAIARANPFRYR